MLCFTAFISLCVPFLSRGQADFTFADSLLECKQYKRAALEYERQSLNSTTVEQMARAMFSKSLAYKKDSLFLKAAQTLQRVPLEAQNKVSFYYEKALCYYLAANFDKAQETINDMYENMDSLSDFTSVLPLQVLVLNELNKYNEAKVKLQQMQKLNIISSQKAACLNALYSKPPKLKSQKIGHILSFVPGLGHIYAQEYLKGTFAFLLNASVLTFGVYQAVNGYYLTAYLAGASILSGTYFGSMKRSELLINRYNYIHTRQFNNKVRQVLFE